MKLSLSIAAATAGALLATGVLLACSDDDATPDRPAFAEADAAPEASPPAVLPPDDAGLIDSPARPAFDAAAPAITCATTPCITRIVAGVRDYCAFATDGVVRCWGDPGPLGDFVDGGDPNAGATPVVLTGPSEIVDVGIGYSRTCVALADGSVSCFGGSNPTPTTVAEVSNAKKLAITDNRSCTVKTTGELFCWGDSYQLGSGAVVMDLDGEQALSATIDQSVGLAVGSKGTLFSWGERALLGRDTPFTQDLNPAPVLGIANILEVVTSNGDTLALAADGRLFGWGRNNSGGLGLGSFSGSSRPVELPFATSAWPAQVALGLTHACSRMTDGTLACWGSKNNFGQLGYESPLGVYIPTLVSGLGDVAQVAVGMYSTCILATDGRVRCWGDNNYGQLGLGTRDQGRHPAPATVAFP